MSLLRRFSLGASLALVVSGAAHADSLSFSSSRSVGCLNVTATLTLTSPAPPGGAVFAASSNSSLLVPPATVTVAAGASSTTFTMQTAQVAGDTFVTVTLTGPSPSTTRVNRSLTLTPNAPTGISATSRVGVNSTGNGVVTMTCAAPAGGLTVALASTNAVLVVPASMTVDEGATSGAFGFSTGQTSTSTAVSVTASRGGITKRTTVTVKPATVKTFGFTFTVPIGGDQTSGVVELDFAAGPGDAVVTVSSANPSVAAPAAGQFNVVAGTLIGSFDVTTSAVLQDTSVVFTVSLNGVAKTATLTVRKNRIESLTVSHKVVSACRVVDAVVFTRALAPTGGLTVNLSTDRPDLVLLSTNTITIPAGFREAAFTISPNGPIASVATAVITAELVGQSPLAPVAVDVDVGQRQIFQVKIQRITIENVEKDQN